MGGRGSGINGTTGTTSTDGAARRRPRRLMRRVLIVVAALIVVGVVAFGGLLLVTPSVGNARALARAQDRAHHAAFPGPPVPARFAAAIESTEDHRFATQLGIATQGGQQPEMRMASTENAHLNLEPPRRPHPEWIPRSAATAAPRTSRTWR